ncbi:PREDICTED: uncharacterized protein LOC107066069 [Polistes dominula]|uniref:Uncharacterized protein LOC107066069 n=1 Tax=Polistes dominula TaxID=743375 RepID=A0ABM1I6H2_POLDO|nr:PREDICTED: uncharacterized protein LOC107066069 [Polistes dominula]
MQDICKPDPCCCPPILVPTCPPPLCSSSTKIKDTCSTKYYEQIGAEMIGNRLIIRMEKDKSKSKKKLDQWEPPCDCDVVEIQRPTSKTGPKILKGSNNNRILFRVQSKGHMGTKEDPHYKPQAVSYEIGGCKGGQYTNDDCRTITFYPILGAPGSQEVHTDQITDGNENVCLLRIKKKPDTTEKVKRNVELELRTPRPPTQPLTPPASSFHSHLDENQK